MMKWGVVCLLIFTPLSFKASDFERGISYDSLSRVIIYLDGSEKTIVIKAFIYPAHEDSIHFQAVENIRKYWESQSNLFVYQLKHQGRKIPYRIKFDINIPEGKFNESGMYVPYDAIPGKYLNRVEVVQDHQMPPLKGVSSSLVRIAGYAPQNSIYLASAFASDPLVAAHEMGHQLGIGHSHEGLMATDVSLLGESLSAISIKQLFQQEEVILFLQYHFYVKQSLFFSSKNLKKGKIHRTRRPY